MTDARQAHWVALGSLAALLGARNVAAQEAAQASGPMEVTVQGQRSEDRGTTVQTLTRKDTQRLGSTTVSELVEAIPSALSGSDARGERLITLRGFEQRQLLVMMDGVPVAVPYEGQLDLNKINLELVDHVTVVKGAGPLLLGPNGLGGAINIVTREPGTGPVLRLSTESAPFYRTRNAISGSTKTGPVGLIAGLSLEKATSFPLSGSFAPTYNEDGGRRNNSDRQNLSGTVKAKWEIDDRQELIATVSRIQGNFGVPPGAFDLTPRYWRWTDWYVTTAALAHAYHQGRLDIDEAAYVSFAGNTLGSYDNGSYTSQRLPRSSTSSYSDRSLGGHIRTSYAFAGSSKAQPWVLRSWWGAKRDSHEAADTSGTSLEVQTVLLTGAAQVEGPLGSTVQALAGLQVDGELPGKSPKGDRPNAAAGFGPMLAVTYAPSRPFSLTATAAQRTRFPTLKERYSQVFGTREPNPGLSPEQATHFALDAVYRPSRAYRITVGLFESEVRELIEPVVIRPQTEQLQNVAKARFYGAEAEIRGRLTSWIELFGGWGYLHTEQLNSSVPIAYRPKQKGLVGATLYPVARLSATVLMRYVGEQSFQNPDTGRWGELGASKQLDARVQLQPTDWLAVWMRGTNLTDANVQSRYSFPEPGRQVFFGASSEWGPGALAQ